MLTDEKRKMKHGDHPVSWKLTIQAHQKKCLNAKKLAKWLHDNAAIRTGALSAGKIVVVPPSRETA